MTEEDSKAADSDWVAAPAVQPLLDAAPAVAESVAPKWEGPLRTTAQEEFESTFDQEKLEDYRARAPAFKRMSGRFDPFDYEFMKPLLEGASYSTFLKRPVITFDDALDHSILLARFWAEEDEASELTRQKEEETWVPPPLVADTTRADRIEAARIAWKEAVAKRNEAVAQWNDYVAALRLRYQQEKASRK